MLPFAEPILLHVEADANVPMPQLRAKVQLTDQEFDLILGDEQAKANVNAMLEQQTQGGVEDRLREAFSGTGIGNSIRLRPVFEDVDPSAKQPTSLLPQNIRSFGQITSDASDPAILSGSSPVASLTCWGSGAINVLRANESAMRLALWPRLSRIQIDRLITARNRIVSVDRTSQSDALNPPSAKAGQPSTPMGALLSEAQIDPKTASRLAVTERSTCHSLWIIAKDRQRVWYNFSVSDESMPQHPRRDDFVW